MLERQLLQQQQNNASEIAPDNTSFPGMISQFHNHPGVNDLGRCNILCSFCQALHWISERSSRSSVIAPKFEGCCKKGDLTLENYPEPPYLLQQLLTHNHPSSHVYFERIRSFNSSLAFSSISHKGPRPLPNNSRGPPVVQISGAIYHLLGHNEAPLNQDPSFAQLYFFDPFEAARFRSRNGHSLDPNLLEELSHMCHRDNRLSHIYRHAQDGLNAMTNPHPGDRAYLRPQFNIQLQRGADKNRENLPTSQEIAIIVPENYRNPWRADILLMRRNIGPGSQYLQRISRTSEHYYALAYPLIFPFGDRGYHLNLFLNGNRSNQRVQQQEFWRWHLHFRPNTFSAILRSGLLIQVFLCDLFATIDQERLDFIENN